MATNTLKAHIWFLALLFSLIAYALNAQCIIGPTTVCGGGTYLYKVENLPAGATIIVWTPSNGSIAPPATPTSTNVIWGAPGTGTLLATFYKSNGTAAVSSCSLNVTILPSPNARIQPSFPPQSCLIGEGLNESISGYCQGQVVEFSATGAGDCPSCYKWLVQGGAEIVNPNSSGQQKALIRFTDPGSASVCVIATSSEGCSKQVCNDYRVYPSPDAGISVPPYPAGTTEIDVCLQTSLTFFSEYSVNGLPLGGFSWVAYEAGSPNNVIGTGSQENFTQVFENPGDYEVTLSVSNCLGCSTQKSIKVHVNEFKGPEITCPSVVCEGELTKYCAPPSCSNPSWVISDNTPYQVSTQSPNCIEVSWGAPPANGYGSVTLSCANAACPIPTTVAVPIIPLNPQIQGITHFCGKSSDYVTYSLPFWPGTEYNWSVDQGIIGIVSGQTPNIFVVQLDNQSKDFTVKACVNNIIAGCQSCGNLNVTFSNYEITVFPSNILCYGFPDGSPTFTVTPTPTINNFQIKWTISSPSSVWTTTGALNDPKLSGLNFQTVFGRSGEFDVNAEILEGGIPVCTGLKMTVTVKEAIPRITGVTGRTSVCPGIEVIYTALPSVISSIYEWSPFNGTTIGGNTAQLVKIKWGPSGPYHLRVRRLLDGCPSDWYTVPISEAPAPNPGFYGETNVCSDIVYTYTSVDLTLDAYLWNVSPGGSIISGQFTSEIKVIWHHSNPADNYIGLFVSRCNRNNSSSKTVILSESNPIIQGPTTICQNVEGLYEVIPLDPAATYTWYVDGVQQTSSGSSINLSFPFVGPVSIRVRIEVKGDMGCPGITSLEMPVEVISNPNAYITQTGYLRCEEGSSVLLTAFISTTSPSTLQWYHFEGGSFVEVQNSTYFNHYTVSGSTLAIKYDPPEQDILGDFKVVVTNAFGCTSEACHAVICRAEEEDPCEKVNFTHWEYLLDDPTQNCGMVTAFGTVEEECLQNSYFWVFNGNGVGFPNRVPVTNIKKPSAALGPFTEPGIYQVALVGVYDCDDEGPIPPDSCLSMRDIPIPLVTDFRERITCNNNSGSFNIDLLNTTRYLPQFDGNISWSWTVDGTLYSTDRNPTLPATPNQTPKVCLLASTDVQNLIYKCEFCKTINLPANVTVGINMTLSSTCVGSSSGKFSAVLDDPNNVIAYHWSFENVKTSTILYSSVPDPTFYFPESGVYIIDLEVVFSNGCRANATRTENIELITVVADITQAPLRCGEVSLSACSQPSSCIGQSFLWSTGKTTPSITVSLSGVYTVTVTNTSAGCSATATTQVKASPPFTGELSGTFEQCAGESRIEILVPYVRNFKYTFSGLGLMISYGPTSGVDVWKIPFPDLKNLVAGNYPYQITVVDASGQPCSAVLSGVVVIHPLPTAVPIKVKYSCSPFKAVLTATNQPVAWYKNGQFLKTAASITVHEGGKYSYVVTNQFGCSNRDSTVVSDPLHVSILTGCYCIEPELINSGQAIVKAPTGTFSYWEWRRGVEILSKCNTEPMCDAIPDLILHAGNQGKITLYAEAIYHNSDGTTETCKDTSGVFCWWLGPCDTILCTPPTPTTRTIACLDSTGTSRQYHIHWDFMDDGITHPCDYQNLEVTVNNTVVGHFQQINLDLINGYWHFEGIFNVDMPTTPFEVCWQIPFCTDATDQRCGVAKVCPRLSNPEHNDDVIRWCTDKSLPYCNNITHTATIECDNVPDNTATHIVHLNLTATINATTITSNCPNFSFYITSVTGVIPVPGRLVRVDVSAPVNSNGKHVINAVVDIPWYDNIGIDDICFQVILAHHDGCWPGAGNLCSKRFCFDASGYNCAFERFPYLFSSKCKQQRGGGSYQHEYEVEFFNEGNITTCSVQNNNPNGSNVVTSFGGNKVRGIYTSINGNLNFEDVFTINNGNVYHVKSILPACTPGIGGDGQDNGDGRESMPSFRRSVEGSLQLMPNPTSGHILFNYAFPIESIEASRGLIIANALGVAVQQFDLSHMSNSGVINYEVSNLPSGVYQVYLLDQKQVLSIKKMVVLKN